MSPADIITKLKADRRAELARAESESAARAESERQQAEQAFNADLSAVLVQLGAPWLLQFRNHAAGTSQAWQDDDGMAWRRTRFDVPGHRPIKLDLTLSTDGWILPTGMYWLAVCDNGTAASFDTLADALIAAECGPDDGESPIPF